MNPLLALQNWYSSHCDGEWEHQVGISIHTIDNPGWHLRVNVNGTEVADKPLQSSRLERSETDWVEIKKDGSFFESYGGAGNLTEMLQLFIDWSSQR